MINVRHFYTNVLKMRLSVTMYKVENGVLWVNGYAGWMISVFDSAWKDYKRMH